MQDSSVSCDELIKPSQHGWHYSYPKFAGHKAFVSLSAATDMEVETCIEEMWGQYLTDLYDEFVQGVSHAIGDEELLKERLVTHTPLPPNKECVDYLLGLRVYAAADTQEAAAVITRDINGSFNYHTAHAIEIGKVYDFDMALCAKNGSWANRALTDFMSDYANVVEENKKSQEIGTECTSDALHLKSEHIQEEEQQEKPRPVPSWDSLYKDDDENEALQLSRHRTHAVVE